MSVQVFTSPFSSLRTLAHRTYFPKSVVLLRQENREGEWVNLQHMLVPLSILQSIVKEHEREPPSLYETLNTEDSQEERTVDIDKLDYATRKAFFQEECACIPITQNQLGSQRYLWDLEDLWMMESTQWGTQDSLEPPTLIPLSPSPSPSSTTPTPAAPKRDECPETPIPQAPKKRKNVTILDS